jgi:hypothetical protein
MDNPNIEGVQYQQGELFGYEIKEYLLDKYGHVCQYCGESENKILEWEHKVPRSRGGSDSVKNATLACRECNQAKGALTPEEWLVKLQEKKNPTKQDEKRIAGILKVVANKPTGVSNRYCAWANSTRRYVERGLFARFGEVECSTGGQTKFNRMALGLPKDHHYDALCVGQVPESGYKDLTNGYCLYAKACGRGNRLRGNVNECGVITMKYTDNAKRAFGFQSGDIVVANVPEKVGNRVQKYNGSFLGRITIRRSGSFALKDIRSGEKIPTVSYRYCKLRQRADGYEYKISK